MGKLSKANINVRLLAICFLVLALAAMVFSALNVRRADQCLNKQLEIQNAQKQAISLSWQFSGAMGYLMSQAREFIATQDPAYLKNYCERLGDHLSAADEIFSSSLLTDDEAAIFNDIKRKADELVQQSSWAMRLMADSIGMDAAQVPSPVSDVVYANGEDKLTSGQMRSLADEYIYSHEYIEAKTNISDAIGSFRRLLNLRLENELSATALQAKDVLFASQVFGFALFLFMVLSYAMFYFLVISPFHKYSTSLVKMKNGDYTPLKPAGPKETAAFAVTFNQIYDELLKQKTELEKERFRFRVAVENTPMIIFEYVNETDTYTAYGTIEQGEGCSNVPMDRVIPDFLKKHVSSLAEEGLTYRILELFTKTTPAEIELRVRLLSADSSFKWARINTSPILDKDNNVSRIIGKITNIESEKAKEFELEEMRSRDPLTGFYNKETGIRMVQDYMLGKQRSESCGMMILDMDNFKALNQAEGHTFADAVLHETANVIRQATGPDDILIRLGGDEFMLFIKNCPKSRATVLGPRIAQSIKGLSARKDSGSQISASIGMCVTQVVDEYGGLYRCAESTLKYVKANRKGTAACYLDVSNELGERLTQLYTQSHNINDIERPKEHQDEDLVAFSLELLGKAKNLDDAIYFLLAKIGRKCGVDRVSILEIDQDYMTCRFTYQWAKKPSDTLLNKVYYANSDELQALSSCYGQDGLCNQYILSGAPQTASCLHAAIWDRGVYSGMLGLEIWEKDYIWPDSQRKLLSELTKIISSFILKARADALSQAKTEFLSRMSHEIRTPMNAISGMTVIAKSMLSDTAKVKDCLDKIDSANTYLLSLINDILDMSRIESGKIELHPESVILREFLTGVETLMRPQAEAKRLNFSVKCEFDPGVALMADSLRLNQILINILGNAIKFTKPGGDIELCAELLDESDEELIFRFSVRDTGIGIPRESLKTIFQAFEQADKSIAGNYGGTGLGLAISSRLVQMMGGHLEVKSEVGKGSVFYFRAHFPRAHPDAYSRAEYETPLEADGHEFSGRRILLAEDNDINREIAQTILEMNGFVTEPAFNGKEAVEMFTNHEPYYYDAVLMDIRMPVMDGLAATKLIRTLGKSDSRTVPIIAMSANAFDDDMKKSLECGMDGHLSKPIEVPKLLDTLGRCIKRRKKGAL